MPLNAVKLILFRQKVTKLLILCIFRLAFNVGVEDIHLLSGEELSNKSIYTVFLNGNIIGVVKNYNKLVETFKQARRCGFIKEFVSIYAHLKTSLKGNSKK